MICIIFILIIIGARRYGSAVDMWSVGCILAELLIHKPLFPGKTEMELIQRIFTLCGTPTVEDWPEHTDKKLYPYFSTVAPKERIKQNLRPQLSRLISTRSNELTEAQKSLSIDLICKLLEMNPSKRFTADQALVYLLVVFNSLLLYIASLI